ncbi:MAG: hypothetical protein ACREEH_06685, partial [Caulobacteraceae bacterium]
MRGLAAALTWLFWLAAAHAADVQHLYQPPPHGHGYQVVGNELVLSTSFKSLDVADLGPDGAIGKWRPVFSLDPSQLASGDLIGSLVCDPGDPKSCFVSTVKPGSDGLTWRMLSLAPSGPTWGSAVWEPLKNLPASIEDVDGQSRSFLIVMARSKLLPPNKSVPGFWIIKRDRLFRLGDLASDPSGLNYAAFLRSAGATPRILLMRGGAGPTLTVFGPDHPHGFAEIFGGYPLAIDGGSLLYEAGSPAGLELAQVTFPEPGPWRGRLLYSPDGSKARPSIAPPYSPGFPGEAVAMDDGEIYAVAWSPSSSEELIRMCDGGPAGAASGVKIVFPGALGGASLLSISGGGAHAIVSRADAWGSLRTWLLSERPSPSAARGDLGCAASSPILTPLTHGSDSPAEPALRVMRRAAVADDGARIPYSVIGSNDRAGPLLIRVYGQYNLPNLQMAETPFERDWIQSGGRLVTP